MPALADNRPEIITTGWDCTRPLITDGADPWVLHHEGLYHLIQSHNRPRGRDSITLRTSASVAGLAVATETVIWEPVGGDHARELWAPELHFIDERWWVYYAADDGDNRNHLMYALMSKTQHLKDGFTEAGKFQTDGWAIDGHPFIHTDGNWYFTWSGWEPEIGEHQQNIYIARMSDPVTLSTGRIRIAAPEYPWEMSHAKINEGPAILKRPGYTALVISADASWMPAYKLGLVELISDLADPLEPGNWVKRPYPVFETGDTGIWGVGHHSVVTENGQDILVYHAKKSARPGWPRAIWAQPFSYNPDGSPDFGTPGRPPTTLPQDTPDFIRPHMAA